VTSTTDFVTSAREVPLELVAGRGHYTRVMAAVAAAESSVWIATANLKDVLVEDAAAKPGRRRNLRRGSSFRSVLGVLDDLARRGVELRLLHAAPPSRAFRVSFDTFPRLYGGGLELRLCPRVHFKAVIVDGAFLYLGSANWTGAGLGAKGQNRRNFELGVVTDDPATLDHVQAYFDHVWRGSACGTCRRRDVCEAPLDAAVLVPRPSKAKKAVTSTAAVLTTAPARKPTGR